MNNIDVVQILKDELAQKQLKNKNYSLRAYSKYLGINPSLLSRLLNNKIPITNKMLVRIQKKLNLTDATLFNIQNALIQERLNPKNKWGIDTFFEDEELEKFKLLQKWHYLPIIELIQIYPKDLNEKIISQKLNISLAEARAAWKNLHKLKIIKLDKNKKRVATISYQALLEKNLFANAMKGRQKEILHKAAEDVTGLDDDLFEQCSFAMAIDSKLVLEAKKKIHEFKKKLALDLHRKSKKKDHVYEFSISLFPLTKESEQE